MLLHEITEIQGIGPKIAEELANYKITKTRHLLKLPAKKMIDILKTIPGLTKDNLTLSILPQARFLELPDMNGQLAEGLALSGMTSYRDLFMQDASVIQNRLAELSKEGMIPNTPDIQLIKEWQLQAGRRSVSGTINVSVKDSDNKPIENAKVVINGATHFNESSPRTILTDKNGTVYFDMLPSKKHVVRVSKDGYIPKTAAIFLKNSDSHVVIFRLDKGEYNPTTVNEFEGQFVFIGLHDTVTAKKMKFNELDPVPPLSVHDVDNDEVTLDSIWRIKIDDIVYVPRVKMPRDKLPANLEIDDIVIDANGELILDQDFSIDDYRIELQKERIR